MKLISRIFSIPSKPVSETQKIYKEWDRLRAKAYGPSDLAEIDAIFSRHLGK